MNFYTNYDSPIGNILLTSDGNDINKVKISKNAEINAVKNDSLPIFIDTKKWLDKYFLGKNLNTKTINLNPKGTPYQKKIWKILTSIPYGETKTYGEIAKLYEEITKKHTSPRAVGSAISKNPILILIPCHRIIGKNGKLTGYSAGIDKKRQLLKIEKINL